MIEKSDSTKKVLCARAGGSGDRRRGRTKLRFCDELEEHVVLIGCRNCRINVESSQEWRRLTDDVESHPEM
jgi:hypothetical protein